MRPTSKRIAENYRMIQCAVTHTQEPSETIACLLQCGMVWDEIKETVAVAVFIKHWSGDGRISLYNYDWSVNVLDDLSTRGVEGSDEIAEIFGNPTEYYIPMEEIHTAHLNQLADQLRVTPAPEPAPEPDHDEVEQAPSEPQEAPTESQEDQTPTTALKNALEATPTRSAWMKGVTKYSIELVTDNEALEKALSLKPFNPDKRSLIRLALLNGATSWSEYSWGGCSLIYDKDIAKRLCTPSELKKTHNGQRDPNDWEQWLDTQARALNQAENLIFRTLERLGMVKGW